MRKHRGAAIMPSTSSSMHRHQGGETPISVPAGKYEREEKAIHTYLSSSYMSGATIKAEIVEDGENDRRASTANPVFTPSRENGNVESGHIHFMVVACRGEIV